MSEQFASRPHPTRIRQDKGCSASDQRDGLFWQHKERRHTVGLSVGDLQLLSAKN